MNRIVLRMTIAGCLLCMTLQSGAQQSFKSVKSIVDHRYILYIAALKQATIESPVYENSAAQPPFPPNKEGGQNKPKISPGIIIEPALPFGKLKDASGFVLSVKAAVRYSFSDELAVLLSAGYTR